MQVAQSLYENGHITYMRTDSTNLANVAVETAPGPLITDNYGADLSAGVAASLQDEGEERSGGPRGHSAGRGRVRFSPKTFAGVSNVEEFKLYDLIWKRTVASQMADARGHRTTIVVELDGAIFQVSGKTIDFPGYLRAYVEGSDDPDRRPGRP